MNKPIPFGKYYLLERINVGGMAEVFRAKAYGVEGFERLVAVKRILPNIAEDKDFIKMFIDEAKLAVQLNHANIAQIFDLGMVGNDYYIALEHVHGRDLRVIFERCREGGEPMPIAQACFAVMKVCEGLDYAHNKRDASGHEVNLVHRDVSPQNVILSFEGEIKIIDFGIAKAAGQGSQTEAGILKGKFGYMSPEQVRGLPIDRRSDVFSCGIVLYELLTGERLFVGESDFSTLEKVRNVEILPPSTYNRRIPEELERIVLKALAKDVEDRYQNAIDLHDELQAFVYTAGEFYSRKDLAGWMKRTFAREIEAETAKLESYKTMAPPIETAPSAAEGPPSRNKPVSAPPPIPPSPALPTENLRGKGNGAHGSGLEWDDDELETAIYDGPPQDDLATSTEPLNTVKDVDAPAAVLAAAAAGAGASISTGESISVTSDINTSDLISADQDLSSLVQKARGWSGPNGPETLEPEPPTQTPTGSTPSSANPLSDSSLPLPSEQSSGVPTTNPPQLFSPQSPAHSAMPMSGGQRTTYEGPTMDLMDRPFAESRAGFAMLIGGGAILLIGGIIAVVLFLGESKPDAAAVPSDDTTEVAQLSAEVLEQTGFDLIVKPGKVEVMLDGKPIGKAPLQVRNLTPGEHRVELTGPAGYFNKGQDVVVVAGEAPRLEISLDAVKVAVTFVSSPEVGADVVLLEGDDSKELGSTPVKMTLDPTKSYQVTFHKAGYVDQTKTLEFDGSSEMDVTAVLEKAGASTSPPDPEIERRPETVAVDKEKEAERRERREREREEKELARAEAREAARAAAEREAAVKKPDPKPEDKSEDSSETASGGTGTLLLGSKPPCKIFVDGRDTGLKTPQRGIKLSAGKHKIVLVNNEFGIRDSFVVRIKAGERTKAIRDLTDEM